MNDASGTGRRTGAPRLPSSREDWKFLLLLALIGLCGGALGAAFAYLVVLR